MFSIIAPLFSRWLVKPPQWLQFALFVGCYSLLDYGYLQVPNTAFAEVIYLHGVSKPCAELINWLSPLEQVMAKQNHILSGKADLEIVRGCDGAGVLFLLVSAIVVFPSTWRHKLIGLAMGIALLYTLNLLRVIGLYYVIAYTPAYFLLIHTYLAPTFMVIVGCGYFFAWALTTSITSEHEST